MSQVLVVWIFRVGDSIVKVNTRDISQNLENFGIARSVPIQGNLPFSTESEATRTRTPFIQLLLIRIGTGENRLRRSTVSENRCPIL